MINVMGLVQDHQNRNQLMAMRASEMERAERMAPLQMEAAQMNILAKRMALQEDAQRRNAMQQFGATGNINALAMADPKVAMQMRMMENRNNMMREQMAMRERLAGQMRSGGVRPQWDATRGVFVVPPTPENPTGSVIQPQGLPKTAEKDKPLTETQGNATGFGLRAARSHNILTDLEDKGTSNTGIFKSVVTGAAEMIPFVGDKMGEAAGSIMNTLPLVGPNSLQQQTEQARRDFVNAVLRKESGAVISPSEFANASKQYFPQPGDSEETIRQKRLNRMSALESLRIQAGPGASKIPRPARSVKDVPDGVDPKLWAVMTPEERAAWQ